MIRKGITNSMTSYRYQLVMCQKSFEGYEPMMYYVAVYIYDLDERDRDKLSGFREGYLIRRNDFSGGCDYFELEDFNHYFVVLDNCDTDKKISNTLYWLRKVRNVKIIIKPVIHLNGYWFEYEFDIYYPFNLTNRTERGFDSFIIAAKEAIKIAKKACAQVHGKTSSEWLKYVIGK